jgi:hypothetical protein
VVAAVDRIVRDVVVLLDVAGLVEHVLRNLFALVAGVLL